MGIKDFDSAERQVDQKVLRKILKVVMDKKATFSSEVAAYIDLDVDKVASIMRQLEESDILETLKPKIEHGDQRLISASKRTNKRSIEQMRQPTWYGLNSNLNWRLKVNDQDLYVDEYHNKIGSKADIDENAISMAVRKMEDQGLM